MTIYDRKVNLRLFDCVFYIMAITPPVHLGLKLKIITGKTKQSDDKYSKHYKSDIMNMIRQNMQIFNKRSKMTPNKLSLSHGNKVTNY